MEYSKDIDIFVIDKEVSIVNHKMSEIFFCYAKRIIKKIFLYLFVGVITFIILKILNL